MSKQFYQLKDRVVMITGATSGLGEQIAYEAARKGARLILCGRREGRLKEVGERCRKLSGKTVSTFALDVSRDESVIPVLADIIKDFPKIDVLVNNAGMGWFEPVLDTTYAIIDQTMNVNALGLMKVTIPIVTQMKNSGQGHVINIASQAGKMATPKSSVYAASKFAVIGFSNSLRLELSPHNIWVTVVNPGPIKTAFFDQADPDGSYVASMKNMMLDPEMLAKEIVSTMGKKRREINRPRVMSMASVGYALFPHIGDWLAVTVFNKK